MSIFHDCMKYLEQSYILKIILSEIPVRQGAYTLLTTVLRISYKLISLNSL